MRKIFGGIRIGLAVFVIALAALSVAVTSLVPVKIRGIPLTSWSVFAVIHFLCFIFRIRVHCTDMARIRSHGGLVFPNHVSALDIVVLYYCLPMRFLAAHDVRDRPLIGFTAKHIGSMFVERENPRSRVAASKEIARTLKESDRPPVALFPEGRLGPGDTLFPFRHGAFRIAVEGGIPYVPCAIRYQPLELVLWRAAAEGEGMWSSIWRMVQYTGHVDVDVIPLDVVHPRPDDSAKALSDKARQDIADALGLPLDTSEDGVTA
jgi:1-acyl-sn-glycerol-3-phosphate acyltransferase